VLLELGLPSSTISVWTLASGAPSSPVLGLNAPVTKANEKVDAVILAVASGIVAANVHWILFPSMRPLTEFAFRVRLIN